MIVVRLLIVSVLFYLIDGCNYSYSPSVSVQFNRFLETINEGDTLTLPSGEQFPTSGLSLQKELRDIHPRVVLYWFYNGSPEYFVSQSKPRQDIKLLCEKVMQFADSAAWENDYYLYIHLMHKGSPLRIVFDYELDTFYFPNNLSLLQQTIDQFSTVDPLEIISMDGGERFLKQRGVVNIRHNKTEVDTTAWDRQFWTGKAVFINSGKFRCIEL